MTDRKADVRDWDSLLEKANAVLSDMAEQYPKTAAAAIERAQAILSAPRVTGAALRNDFFPIVHNIKGQGATFNYPLMTDIGAFLCAYIRARSQFKASDIALMRRYVQDMDTIIVRRLTGDGGDFGRDLRARIKKERI